MAFNDDDESASLALAHQLQAEFDRLAHNPPHNPSSSQYQQSSLLDDTHKSPFKRPPEDPGDRPDWRVHISDEEYARQLQAEENATYTPPMSDEEFARLLQMQEVEAFIPESSSSAVPPSSIAKGKFVSEVPPPPSPPQTPASLSRTLFPPGYPSGYHEAYLQQQPPVVCVPEAPEQQMDLVEAMDLSRNDPAIEETLRLARELQYESTNYPENDEMLARILQDEYGEDPRCAQDAEIARILQLEYDTNFLYSGNQGYKSQSVELLNFSSDVRLHHSISQSASGPSVPFASPAVVSPIHTTGPFPAVPMTEPPVPSPERITFPMVDLPAVGSLPPIPMVGSTGSPPVDHSTLDVQTMTDSEAINWFRDHITKPLRCGNCDHKFTALQLAHDTTSQTIHCTCPKCQTSICLACMETACNNSCSSSPESCASITHCRLSRQVLLFRLLSSLDRFYIYERTQQKSRDQARPRQAQRQGSGTGYGRDPLSGPFFTPPAIAAFPQQSHLLRLRPQQAPQTSQARAQSSRDEQLLSFFRGITLILKNSSTEPGLLNLMRISLLGQAVEELLRNDSISDCSERASLYAALLYALESIASNPCLTEFYTSPRDEIQYTDGLEKIISGEGRLIKDTQTSRDRSNDGEGKTLPLVELMENLGKQAETFYKTAGKVAMNQTDRNVTNSIDLCRSIINLRRLLRSNAANHNHPQPTSLLHNIPDQSELYRLACAELAYDEFPTGLNVHFTFHQWAKSVQAINPRRTLTLAKELSTMATSLPSGIFVRSMPNRPDCIKVLIAGPEGTPYYGGLFEFDIFAPGNYPAESPKVHLTTTANGRVRFNPNLYADGKVCLSLLGTWPGTPDEQWRPYKSTIMQVLVSIQGMLLCQRPYFNEPGSGEPRDTAASFAYDQDVRLQTVRVAMCDWMTSHHSQSLWKDVIKMHFTHSADCLRQYIMSYSQKDPRFRNYTASTMQYCGLGGLPAPVIPMPAPPAPLSSIGGANGPQPPWMARLSSGVNTTPNEDLVQRFEQGLEMIKGW